jgi:hypothetical protein
VVVQDGARLRVGETSFQVTVAPAARLAPATTATAAAAEGASEGSGGKVGRPAPSRSPDGFSAASPHRTRAPAGAATRLWMPAALSFAAILATAIALLLYFALR